MTVSSALFRTFPRVSALAPLLLPSQPLPERWYRQHRMLSFLHKPYLWRSPISGAALLVYRFLGGVNVGNKSPSPMGARQSFRKVRFSHGYLTSFEALERSGLWIGAAKENSARKGTAPCDKRGFSCAFFQKLCEEAAFRKGGDPRTEYGEGVGCPWGFRSECRGGHNV